MKVLGLTRAGWPGQSKTTARVVDCSVADCSVVDRSVVECWADAAGAAWAGPARPRVNPVIASPPKTEASTAMITARFMMPPLGASRLKPKTTQAGIGLR